MCATVHEALFDDVFWGGIDGVGEQAEASNDERAALECTRDGDAAKWEGVGGVGT